MSVTISWLNYGFLFDKLHNSVCWTDSSIDSLFETVKWRALLDLLKADEQIIWDSSEMSALSESFKNSSNKKSKMKFI